MFGIDFSELLVIGLVALVVIGPKRLPKTARTLGVLFGRGQRFVHDMKSQVEQEIHLQEMHAGNGIHLQKIDCRDTDIVIRGIGNPRSRNRP